MVGARKSHQLHNTVPAPAFAYASNIWYVPLFNLAHSENSHGSVGTTKLYQSIQDCVKEAFLQ